MGNCCGRPQKSGSNFSGAGKGHKLGSSSSPQEIPLREISSGSTPIKKPEPAKASTNSDLDKQKILEATEKRLEESRKRGVQQGQGKLSQALQKEKEKNLKDYAAEELAQRQENNPVDWRD